jgi:hypothetical protein
MALSSVSVVGNSLLLQSGSWIERQIGARRRRLSRAIGKKTENCTCQFL